MLKHTSRLRHHPLSFLRLRSLFSSAGRHHLLPISDAVLRLSRLGLERRLTSLFLGLIRSPFPLVDLFHDLAARSHGSAVPRAFSALLKAYSEAGMPAEAVSAFLALGARGFFPSVRSCNFLMRFLSDHLGDARAVRSILDQAVSFGITPNPHSYAILIKALCRGGDFEDAFEALQEARDRSIELDGFAYATLVQGLCSAGKADLGREVLGIATAAGAVMNAFPYDCVIAALCREGRLEEAEVLLLEEMERHGVVPDSYGFGCLIRAYCEVGDILRALGLHESMESSGIMTNCTIVSSILRCLCRLGMSREALEHFQRFRDSSCFFLDEVAYHVAMDARCKLGDMREAVLMLHEMKGRRLVPDVYHHTVLIDGYCRKGELHNAWKVFGDMVKQGIDLDLYTYNALAGGLCRNGCVQGTLDVLDHMISYGLQKPNSKTYSIVIEGFCRSGCLREAETLFGALMGSGDIKLDVVASAMVSGYLEAGCVEKAYGLFQRMYKSGTIVDKIALSALLYNACKAGQVQRAYVIYEIMSSMELALNAISYNNLIAALCRLADFAETRRAHSLLLDLLSKDIVPNVVIYTTLMHGYCKVNHLEEAYKLFLEMKKKGIEPDVVACTVLMDASLKCIQKNGNRVEKGRALYVSRALYPEVVRQMEMLDIKPDVVCYTVLIDGHFRISCPLDALRFFSEMKDVGLIPDVVTYTSLVSFYSRHGDIERVEDLIHEMQEKGVVPDDVFAIFVNEKVRRNAHLTI